MGRGKLSLTPSEGFNVPTFTAGFRFQFSEGGKQVFLPAKGHLSRNYIQGQGRKQQQGPSQPHNVSRTVPATPLKLTQECQKIKPQSSKNALM